MRERRSGHALLSSRELLRRERTRIIAFLEQRRVSGAPVPLERLIEAAVGPQ